jgi:hypothetical protein
VKPKRYGANLGLASTEELFREIIVRFTMINSYPATERAVVLAEMLGRLDAETREYRTAGSSDD